MDILFTVDRGFRLGLRICIVAFFGVGALVSNAALGLELDAEVLRKYSTFFADTYTKKCTLTPEEKLLLPSEGGESLS